MSLEFDIRLSRSDFTLRVAGSWSLTGVTSLFGPSGCGKTSLLRAIAGLEPQVRGLIRFDGEDWHRDTGRSLPIYKRGIGLVFQHAALFTHLSVRGNLAYALRRTPCQRRRLDLDTVADRCGLTALLDRRTERLSGGECQRVALARALITSPRLLILDEPLASLDASSKADLLPYLVDLHQHWRIPVLYVTHHVDELATIADRVVRLQAGRIVEEAPVAEFLADPASPCAQGEQAQVVIDTTVDHFDRDNALLSLRCAGGLLWTTVRRPPTAEQVRVIIHAQNVSIALQQPGPSSILNCLPATIRRIEQLPAGRSLVVLDLNGTALLARITTWSAQNLPLRVGQAVYAQVKAMALAAVG